MGLIFLGKSQDQLIMAPGCTAKADTMLAHLKWSVIEDRNFYVKPPGKQHPGWRYTPDTCVFSSGEEDILSFAASIHSAGFACWSISQSGSPWDPANAQPEEFSPTDNPISRAAVFLCQARWSSQKDENDTTCKGGDILMKHEPEGKMSKDGSIPG